MMLKAPVEQQCAGHGLKGCGDLVDGVMLYVDGDKPNAMHKLKEAAAKNSPEQLRPFANALKDVLPGEAGHEIAEILSGEINPSQAPGDVSNRLNPYQASVAVAAPGAVSAAPDYTATLALDALRNARLENIELAMAAPVDPVRFVTESANPRMPGAAIQTICEIAGSNGPCVRTLWTTPLVVTDAVTPVGCKSEVFIGAGDDSGKLVWFAQTNFPGFHGARFLVKTGQTLTVVARGIDSTKELDARCSVAWAGFRPRFLPSNIGSGSD